MRVVKTDNNQQHRRSSRAGACLLAESRFPVFSLQGYKEQQSVLCIKSGSYQDYNRPVTTESNSTLQLYRIMRWHNQRSARINLISFNFFFLSVKFGEFSGGNSRSNASNNLRFKVGRRLSIRCGKCNGDCHHETIGIASGCFESSEREEKKNTEARIFGKERG